MRKLRIVGHRIHQEKVGTGELAGELRSRRALQIPQHRQTDQGRQRLPVSRHTTCDHTELQRPERRGAEHLRRIESCHGHLRILEGNATVGERQRSRELFIHRGHLDLLIEGKDLR